MWFVKETFSNLVVDLNKKKSGDFFTMVAHIISALFSIFCLLAGLILTPYIFVLYLNTYQVYALIFLILVILLDFILLKVLYTPNNEHTKASKVRDIITYIIFISIAIHNALFKSSLLGGYQNLFIFDATWLNLLYIYLLITLIFYIAIYLAFFITLINIKILDRKHNNTTD